MKRLLATAGALAVLVTGCGAETPDYKSIWTTSSTTPAAPADNQPVPLWQYLEDSGVVGEPIAPEKIPHLTVTMPSPPGWHPYNNPNLAPGTRMIAKGNTYPTAMMLAFPLHGDFDVPKALKDHGYADAQLSENFKQLNASNADWKGFPSAMIEGSYDQPGGRVHTYNRVVIPVTGAPDFVRYLVQFTVTGMADKAAEQAPEIQQVIDGFDVAVK